jgi:hypothetical protein
MVQGWITYDNRTVTMEEMSHQHMSNIYYYTKYILPELYCDSTRNDIFRWLLKRFGGVILNYHPHPDFLWEKDYLLQRGYLKEDGRIVVNNNIIGWYEQNKSE